MQGRIITHTMLAYVFWHRPRADTSAAEYEDGLRAFHARLALPSASFRIAELPFGDGGDGYEDWYLVEGWTELGELNFAAVSGQRRSPHDAVAGLTAEGWAGVYLLRRGEPRPPISARWVSKPREQSYDTFFEDVAESTVWQRQMTLGPAPEFCLADGQGDGARVPVYPDGATL